MSKNPLVDDSTKRERYQEPLESPSPTDWYVDMGTPSAEDKGWASGVPFWENTTNLALAKKHDLEYYLSLSAIGIDALGVAMSPLASSVSNAVGWLAEHLRPIREFLDLLCGNADLIKDVASSWENISKFLHEAYEPFVSDIERGTSNWRGMAANAYRETAHGVAKLLYNASRAANDLGQLTMSAGEAVATVRVWVRDTWADVWGTAVDCVINNDDPVAALRLLTKVLYRTIEVAIRLYDTLTEMERSLTAANSQVAAGIRAYHEYRSGGSHLPPRHAGLSGEVDQVQLRRHISLVVATASGADLAYDAAREISESYDVGVFSRALGTLIRPTTSVDPGLATTACT